MQSGGSAEQWHPPVEVIDALELARWTIPITVPDTGWPPASGDGVQLEITDSEGVPLARVRRDDSGSLTVDQWLGRRSSRPFERFHRPPSRSRVPATTVVVDAATEPAALAQALSVATGPALVLMLASVAADRTGAAVAAARSFVSIITLHEDVELRIAPAAADQREAVVAAFSGGSVTSLLGGHAAGTGRGLVVLFTGLSGSGKSTVARAVRDQLMETTDATVSLLDGDEVRRHLSAGLGFGPADREINIRRIGWVAAEIAYHGGVAVCSPIAPFDATRREVRALAAARGAHFVLIHISTPLAECERRDRKGLYARARAGEIPDFTGISAPYEVPTDADLVIDTSTVSIDAARDRVMAVVNDFLQ